MEITYFFLQTTVILKGREMAKYRSQAMLTFTFSVTTIKTVLIGKLGAPFDLLLLYNTKNEISSLLQGLPAPSFHAACNQSPRCLRCGIL